MRCRLLGRDISPVDPCETDCFPWFCASLFGRSFSSSAISIAYNISAEGRLQSWKIKTSGLKPRVIFFLTEWLPMYNKRIVQGLWNNRISHINTGSTKVKVNSIKKLKVREQRQSLYKLYWKPEFPHLKNHHEINYTDFFSRKSQCENGYKEK